MYSKKGVWFQYSTDLIPEIPISKCPQARIFSGEKACRNPILIKVMTSSATGYRSFFKRIAQAGLMTFCCSAQIT